MKRIVPIILSILFLAACDPAPALISAPVGQNAQVSASTHIAFNSFHDSTLGISLMNGDGSGQVSLPTQTDEPDAYICNWSPDGKKILFVSEDEEPYEIYAFDVNGRAPTLLTGQIAYGSPVWSPDSKKIAFIANPVDNFEIYTMNADGSKQTNLTNHAGADINPSWSPDGTHIAFVSDRDGTPEIYMMKADGTEQKRLTYNTRHNMRPTWSPDGKQIVFVSEQNYSADIYLIDVAKALGTSTASSEINLTNNPAYDQTPIWSPDGSKIAFVSDRDGDLEIYVMKPDGSGVTHLTNSPGYDADPEWSPDGSQIAFVSQRDGHFEIYVMNKDGSGQIRLTNNPQGSVSPKWQP